MASGEAGRQGIVPASVTSLPVLATCRPCTVSMACGEAGRACQRDVTAPYLLQPGLVKSRWHRAKQGAKWSHLPAVRRPSLQCGGKEPPWGTPAVTPRHSERMIYSSLCSRLLQVCASRTSYCLFCFIYAFTSPVVHASIYTWYILCVCWSVCLSATVKRGGWEVLFKAAPPVWRKGSSLGDPSSHSASPAGHRPTRFIPLVKSELSSHFNSFTRVYLKHKYCRCVCYSVFYISKILISE